MNGSVFIPIKGCGGKVLILDFQDHIKFKELGIRFIATDYGIKRYNTFYAVCSNSYCKKTKSRVRQQKIHRMIMNPPKNMAVDHINGNGLDNRRSNLRICTPSQNSLNRKPHRNSSSRYRGVSFNKKSGKYVAQIIFNRKNRYLGIYENEIDAAIAYENAARELHGDFFRSQFDEFLCT